MEPQAQPALLNLEEHLRRSKGRGGRTISATARVTREEQNEMESAARLKGQSLSEWCREVLLAAARGETVTPVFTELVALRLLLLKSLRGDLKSAQAFDAEVFSIRETKHKAAGEVMQQYAAREKAR